MYLNVDSVEIKYINDFMVFFIKDTSVKNGLPEYCRSILHGLTGKLSCHFLPGQHLQQNDKSKQVTSSLINTCNKMINPSKPNDPDKL